MKFSIKQNVLMEHLNYVIRGISNKNLVPILNCIKFELNDDGLDMISTDNNIAIKTHIDRSLILSIDSTGETVVAGRFIYDIINKLPNTILDIEADEDGKFYIFTKNSKFYLNCNDVNEFPEIDLKENDACININSNIFKSIINQVSFASSTQESKSALTGIDFKFEGNKLICTASDRVRLACKEIILDQTLDKNFNLIIPTRNLREMVHLLPDSDKIVKMFVFENKIIFKINDIIFLTSVINDIYPDTSRLIPDNFLISLLINLNEFYGAIDRAALLSNNDEKNVILLEASGDVMKITSNVPEIGRVDESIIIKNVNNTNIDILLSARYMMDALKTFNGDEINLLLNGEKKPVIIKCPNQNDLTQVVMPFRPKN